MLRFTTSTPFVGFLGGFPAAKAGVSAGSISKARRRSTIMAGLRAGAVRHPTQAHDGPSIENSVREHAGHVAARSEPKGERSRDSLAPVRYGASVVLPLWPKSL